MASRGVSSGPNWTKIDEEIRTMISSLNPKLERKAHNLLAAVKRQESSSGLSNGEGQWEKELYCRIHTNIPEQWWRTVRERTELHHCCSETDKRNNYVIQKRDHKVTRSHNTQKKRKETVFTHHTTHIHQHSWALDLEKRTLIRVTRHREGMTWWSERLIPISQITEWK